MFRLTAMSSRRALFTGGLASLLPVTLRAQSPLIPEFLDTLFGACGQQLFRPAD
jgi:hypothetical protein